MKLIKQKITTQTERNLICGCPFASQSVMFGGSWALAMQEY